MKDYACDHVIQLCMMVLYCLTKQKKNRQSYRSGLHIRYFFLSVCFRCESRALNNEHKKVTWCCYFLCCCVLCNANNNSNLRRHNVISFSALFKIKCNIPLCPRVLPPLPLTLPPLPSPPSLLDSIHPLIAFYVEKSKSESKFDSRSIETEWVIECVVSGKCNKTVAWQSTKGWWK